MKKRTIVLFGSALVLGGCAVILVSNLLLQRYLLTDIPAGGGTVRITGPRLHLGWRVSSTRIQYSSPSIRAVLDNVTIGVRTLRSLIRRKPDIILTCDSARIRYSRASKRPAGSSGPSPVVFPDVSLPLSLRGTFGHVSLSGDSAVLLSADSMTVIARSPSYVKIEAAALHTPRLPDVSPGITVEADWHDDDSLAANLRLRNDGDSIELRSRHPKNDLVHFRAGTRIQLASLEPYLGLIDAPPSLPTIDSLRLSADLDLARSSSVTCEASARVHDVPGIIQAPLSPQSVLLRVHSAGSRASFTLRGEGQRETIRLAGTVALPLSDITRLRAAHCAESRVSIRGDLRGIPVRIHGKTTVSDLVLNECRILRDSLSIRATTGEGSRILVDINRSVSGRHIGIEADIVPVDRWVSRYVDTGWIRFSSFAVRGVVENGGFTFSTRAVSPAAYGAYGDSLHAVHRADRSGYHLKSATIYHGDTAWHASGHVRVAEGFPHIAFRVEHESHGTALFEMRRRDSIHAAAERLIVRCAPYRFTKILRPADLTVDGEFGWNFTNRTGASRITVSGGRDPAPPHVLDAGIAWTAESLFIDSLSLRQGNHALRFSGSVNKKDDFFHAMRPLHLKNTGRARLEADGFDLSLLLSLFTSGIEERGGAITGRMVYSRDEGFTGDIHIAPFKPGFDDMSVGPCRLTGSGAELTLQVSSTSPLQPLLNTNGVISIRDVFNPSQAVRFRLSADTTLNADFAGTLDLNEALNGTLTVTGAAILPFGSGSISGCDLSATVHVPVDSLLKKTEIATRTCRMRYSFPPLDTQTVDGRVTIRDGLLDIEHFSVTSPQNDRITGAGRIPFSGDDRDITFRASGSSFATGFGRIESILMRDFDIDIERTREGTSLTADIARGSIRYRNSPFVFETDASGIGLSYRVPPRHDSIATGAARPIPDISFTARLRNARLSHRLQSVANLQNLVRRMRTRRETADVAPLSRPKAAIHARVILEGQNNRIDTDIARLNVLGELTAKGPWPYVLMSGRLHALDGEIGTSKQAYALNRMQIKWLDYPVEEGTVSLEAAKQLADSCGCVSCDSCRVIISLNGPLHASQFTYETDCGGAFGAGGNVAAILYSVRRGCYSWRFAGGGTGDSYSSQALQFLEPALNDWLSPSIKKYSQNWITSTRINGLGALADSTARPVSIELESREFYRFRLKARGGVRPNERDPQSVYDGRLGLQWRPPIDAFIDLRTGQGGRRDDITLEASIETVPEEQRSRGEDEILRRIGLIFKRSFWKWKLW